MIGSILIALGTSFGLFFMLASVGQMFSARSGGYFKTARSCVIDAIVYAIVATYLLLLPSHGT